MLSTKELNAIRSYFRPQWGNIRIYHKFEGRIVKPAPRIAVWHHEAFQSYPHMNNGFFFLLNNVLFFYLFILKYM